MRSLFFALFVSLVVACGAHGPEPDREPVLANGAFDTVVDGRTMHYEVHGQGPIVMTVPNSWGLSHAGLRGMYRNLESHLTLVYFDPRGMGGSSAVTEPADRGPDAVREDFDALRRHLGLERVHAIGWSNGATNLILLAAEHPDTIDHAIFLHGVASFGPEDTGPLAERYAELFQAFGTFTQEMSSTPELSARERAERVKRFDLEVWFPWVFADREAAPAKLAAAFGDAEFSWEHAQYTQQVWSTIDLAERLGEIRARSLVIAGAHDMLPVAKSEEMAEAMPEAELVVFEQSGHFAPLEEPERFRETVLEFLGVTGP